MRPVGKHRRAIAIVAFVLRLVGSPLTPPITGGYPSIRSDGEDRPPTPRAPIDPLYWG